MSPLTPDWPDDPESVEVARAEPEVLAKKTLKQVADHSTEIISALDKKPAVIGHSTGGLLAEILAGQGLSAATVAVDPASSAAFCHCRFPRSGRRRPVSWSIRGSRYRAIMLTFDQFKYSLGEHAWTRMRRRSSTTRSMSPAPGSPSSQMGNANLNPWTEAKVDTMNPDRGPVLIIEAKRPTRAMGDRGRGYKRQKRNPGVTELVKMPERGHSLRSITAGARSPKTALEFVQRFA